MQIAETTTTNFRGLKSGPSCLTILSFEFPRPPKFPEEQPPAWSPFYCSSFAFFNTRIHSLEWEDTVWCSCCSLASGADGHAGGTLLILVSPWTHSFHQCRIIRPLCSWNTLIERSLRRISDLVGLSVPDTINSRP